MKLFSILCITFLLFCTNIVAQEPPVREKVKKGPVPSDTVRVKIKREGPKFPDIKKIAVGGVYGASIFAGFRAVYQPSHVGLKVEGATRELALNSDILERVDVGRMDVRFIRYPDKKFRMNQFAGVTVYRKESEYAPMIDFGFGAEYRIKFIGLGGDFGLLVPLSWNVFPERRTAILGSLSLMVWF